MATTPNTGGTMNSTMTSKEAIATMMNEWDRQVAFYESQGYARKEAVVIVTAMFNEAFAK
jgi:hypothetical protein